MTQDTIIIIDLGSTENPDLARYIRSLGVYSEILPHDIDVDKVDKSIKGIILNGGMNRIVDGEMVDVDPKLYDLEIPVLSIDHPNSKADLIFKEKPTMMKLNHLCLINVR